MPLIENRVETKRNLCDRLRHNLNKCFTIRIVRFLAIKKINNSLWSRRTCGKNETRFSDFDF